MRRTGTHVVGSHAAEYEAALDAMGTWRLHMVAGGDRALLNTGDHSGIHVVPGHAVAGRFVELSTVPFMAYRTVRSLSPSSLRLPRARPALLRLVVLRSSGLRESSPHTSVCFRRVYGRSSAARGSAERADCAACGVLAVAQVDVRAMCSDKFGNTGATGKAVVSVDHFLTMSSWLGSPDAKKRFELSDPLVTGSPLRTAQVQLPGAGRWKIMLEAPIDGEFTMEGDPKFKVLAEHELDIPDDPSLQ